MLIVSLGYGVAVFVTQWSVSFCTLFSQLAYWLAHEYIDSSNRQNKNLVSPK